MTIYKLSGKSLKAEALIALADRTLDKVRTRPLAVLITRLITLDVMFTRPIVGHEYGREIDAGW